MSGTTTDAPPKVMPMVGLGGSSGAIPALMAFLAATPPDTGMAFVVIMHLSPTHESTLGALLARSATIPVETAKDGDPVLPDHVYVIPPGKYLTVTDGHLRLVDSESERGRRVAVDLFFRSLAETHGPHATAIVLSGSDGDGAVGIKRVKELGGLTIAQDPAEALTADMPRAAIDTGMVDWVLPVAEIPDRLVAYYQNEGRLPLPPEGDPPAGEAPPLADESGASLHDVLAFLRRRTGRDFACYKPATVLRRIGRRMQVTGADDLAGYLAYLRSQPGEADALLQDLLISVTNFFRDREAFEALESHVPSLFEGKRQGDAVRVWVPACATGEEAYSIAILLLEHASMLDSPPSLQVFACDLNEDAIKTARAGRYATAIEADVSEGRLKRFFVKGSDGYRVRRDLREIVLFASHDLLKDAPFSRMDLVSCRNLLIYLERDAQQRVLDTFHFAMKPGGLLFLGSSEAVDDGNLMFRVLDKKHRLFVHVASARWTSVPIPVHSSTLARVLQAHEKVQPIPVAHAKAFARGVVAPIDFEPVEALDRQALAELHLKLVERHAPPSVIVNAEHDVVHLSEHAGAYLRFTGGEPTMNLLRVVNPALRVELRAVLFRAAESSEPVAAIDVPAQIDGQARLVDLHVYPAPEVAPGFLLVTFAAHHATSPSPDGTSPSLAPDLVVRHIERELEQLKLRLRDTVDQYEASTDELKASNEELQAMNEELRSATEELETSREELQSINEELSTVNHEMTGKMAEVAHANSDLQNLMASTSIATVFLDRALAIMRYTPEAAGLFNIIPSDVGRPLEHLRHRLDYPALIADAEQVLRTLVPVEKEVTDGTRWFLARLQPYRTLEDHIAGAVLTLVDVTERNRATEALRRSEERMRILIESARDWAIFTTDPERRVDSWSSGAESVFGYTEAEMLGQPADVLFTPEDRARGDAEEEARLARESGRAENERWHARKDGTLFYGSGSVMPLRDSDGALRGFLKIMRDLTSGKRTEEALREHMDELTRFNDAVVGRESRMIELKAEVNELLGKLGQQPRYQVEP